uniref:Matrix metallopeptidase 28 n=1 Tax=Aquila chrysaetos chrysaetos TaxID=223781 RepID=A0A663E303_AQUCH
MRQGGGFKLRAPASPHLKQVLAPLLGFGCRSSLGNLRVGSSGGAFGGISWVRSCCWWDTWVDFQLWLGKAMAFPSTGKLSSTPAAPGFAPLAGGRWYKRHLTYRVVNWPSYLPQHEVRLAVKAAFELWSNVSSLVFWEARDGPADIRLTFFHGDHNDGLNNAFDGPGAGRALAHAFFPRRGEAHFDSAERWSLHSGKGRNLFIVVAHEVGHTLGLEHSPVKSALMSPYYKKLSKDFVLSWDDILAVQNLYGEPGFPKHPSVPLGMFPGMESEEQGREQVPARGEDYAQGGSHYWVVPTSGNASDPRPLQTRWAARLARWLSPSTSPEAGPATDPVGVGSNPSPLLFPGGRCWCYTGSTLAAGFPQKCSARGLPRHPDTALYFQQLRRLVLFKGPKYFVVSEETLGVEPYYPRSLRDWEGLPPGTAGALTHRDGFIYFFRDDQKETFGQKYGSVLNFAPAVCTKPPLLPSPLSCPRDGGSAAGGGDPSPVGASAPAGDTNTVGFFGEKAEGFGVGSLFGVKEEGEVELSC